MKDHTYWTERAARLFCVIAYCAVAYVILKYFLSVVLVPIAAFVAAWGVSSAAKRLSHRTGLPQGVWAFLLVSAALAACVFTVIYVCGKLVAQVSDIAQAVSADGFASLKPIFSALERVPVFRELVYSSEEYAEEELTPLVSRALSTVSGALTSAVSRALKATPSALLAGLVTVMSVYYMSVDFDGVCAFLGRLLPRGVRDRVSRLKGSAISVGMRFLRAYAILFAVTFCELAVGLFIICPSYALVCALGIAALDILPVFGAGFVLLPWGAVCLLRGDVFMGVGLLVLYAVITVVRQLIEPRIVGGSIGIHPLGAMLSMFVGFRLFGVVGMLTAPMAVSIVMAAMRGDSKYTKDTRDARDARDAKDAGTRVTFLSRKKSNQKKAKR